MMALSSKMMKLHQLMRWHQFIIAKTPGTFCTFRTLVSVLHGRSHTDIQSAHLSGCHFMGRNDIFKLRPLNNSTIWSNGNGHFLITYLKIANNRSGKLLCNLSGYQGNQCRHFSSGPPREDVMTVFDRNAKRIQRNRAALSEDYKIYDYIKEEIGWRVSDRLADIKRSFKVGVELGCGRGYVGQHITEETAELWYQCDMAENVLEQAECSPEVPSLKIHMDEEFIPFANDSIDLFVSCLSLHWVNDLPGTLRQMHTALKNDGVFLGAMFGGETLYELRVALQLAETEREGGFAPHISPFTEVRDLGNLLTRAGYNMITMDIDEITVAYPTMFELMKDLKGMGENNCAIKRRSIIHRDTLQAAAAIYKEMYGNEDGTIPATFQVLYMIGWKPDPTQSKAAERGSGEVSLKDLDRVDELMKDIKKLRGEDDKKDG